MPRKKKIVYGDRICSCGCKGLLTGKAYRYRYGTRKRYFDNIIHIESYIDTQLQKYLPKHMSPKTKTVKEETKKFIREHLEIVYVKPKR